MITKKSEIDSTQQIVINILDRNVYTLILRDYHMPPVLVTLEWRSFDRLLDSSTTPVFLPWVLRLFIIVSFMPDVA